MVSRAIPWSVPRMWDDFTVAILASGPSMSRSVADTVLDAGIPAIAVNNTIELSPWADVLYAADAQWWTKHHAGLKDFAGLRVTCSEVPFADVKKLRETGREGFDPDPSCIRTGGNSGYQAIHVAAHAGAKRILLCGFDMRGGHWHGRHVAPLRDHGSDIYVKWIARFATLAPALEARGIEVINCTPGSALKIWPIRSLDSALENDSEMAA